MRTTIGHIVVIARAGLRDALRRRLFAVLAILSVVYVGLYATGLAFVWHESTSRGGFGGSEGGIDQEVVVSATFAGLSMFGVHFLGAVAGTFLALGAVRGDAELGVLQQVLVRPIGRSSYLVGRFLAAALVTCAYVAGMTLACLLVTRGITGWWPDAPVLAVLRMSGAGLGIVAVALAGSVLLGTAANGIATFMVFGLGLLGGLLDQLGEAISSPATRDVGAWVLRFLPFEAMYQWALDALTTDTIGMERIVISLGPFGGARSHGVELPLGMLAFCAVLLVLASIRFRRMDL